MQSHNNGNATHGQLLDKVMSQANPVMQVNKIEIAVGDLLKHERQHLGAVPLIPVVEKQVVSIESLNGQTIIRSILNCHSLTRSHVPGQNGDRVPLLALSPGEVTNVGLQPSMGLRWELMDDMEDFHGLKVPTSAPAVNT